MVIYICSSVLMFLWFCLSLFYLLFFILWALLPETNKGMYACIHAAFCGVINDNNNNNNNTYNVTVL